MEDSGTTVNVLFLNWLPPMSPSRTNLFFLHGRLLNMAVPRTDMSHVLGTLVSKLFSVSNLIF